MKIEKIYPVLQKNHDKTNFDQVHIYPENIQVVMINEIVPAQTADDFYSGSQAAYYQSVYALFQQAGITITSMQDVLDLGIYITNAIKIPKTDTTIPKSSEEISLPYLEKELAFFPNIKVIMCMGDIAKKAVNKLYKDERGRNIIPAISTYKLRNSSIMYHHIHILPSYIMTGKNILIEKSKFQMAAEDVVRMLQLIAPKEKI